MGPKRRTLAWLGVLCLTAAGCQQLARELRATQQPQVLKSWDGVFQVTVPAGWRTDRDLNDKADLAVSQRAEEHYLIVLSESAKDFADMDLARHSQVTLDQIVGTLTSSSVSPVKKLTIGNQPALQYDFAGVTKNIKVHYLHTTVELGGYYHQILAWTLASRWDRNQAALRAATASFKQSQGGAR